MIAAVIAESARRPSRTRRARRPGSRIRRRLARFLLGAALAIAGVVVPLEAPALPDSPVQAQDPPESDPVIRSGTPEDCPDGYEAVDSDDQADPDGPLCVLKVTTACPYDPVKYDRGNPGASPRLQPWRDLPGGLMDADEDPIGTYDGFCEARYLEAEDPTGYGSCTNPERTKGFIVITHIMKRLVDGEGQPIMDPILDDRGNQRYHPRYTSDGREIMGSRDLSNPMEVQRTHSLCRIIHPTVCLIGSQVTPSECRSVRRRAWSCTDHAGYIPGNAFNTCYKPLSKPSDPHPACGDGAPRLVAVTCADYAANDYTLSPTAADWACTSPRYSTGSADAALSPSAANAYWCEFDPADLRVECHGSPPPAGCGPATTAFCLKRASGTGGCNAIANTIRCRLMQAEFVALTGQAQKVRAEEIRREGCQPCVILPFKSAPADCPADLFNEPNAIGEWDSRRGDLSRAHEFETSYYSGSTSHVCRPLYFRDHGIEDCARIPGACADPPEGNLDWSSSHSSGLAVVNSPVVANVTGLPTSSRWIVGYSYWTKVQRQAFEYQTFPLDDGSPIRKWPVPDAGRTYSGVYDLASLASKQAACVVNGLPFFKLKVEELWPDSAEHRDEIMELFGSDSLEWWNGLTADEQERLTEARDLEYLPRLNNTERIEQIEHRAEVLVSEVDCNYGSDVWCRWVPSHSGHFKLIAAGGWTTKKWTSIGPRSRSMTDRFMQLLQNPSTQSQIRDILTRHSWTEADVGLNPDLNDFLPFPSGDPIEVAYTLAGGRCPSRDFRVVCGGSSSTVNYTESEPVGIVVHEVRVATRTPNS